MRSLILSCSATKRPIAGEIPAIERYDGPAFRVLRANRPADLSVWILSAEHGLIGERTPIADYDRRMSPAIAAELAPRVGAELIALERAGALAGNVLLFGGAAYRDCLRAALEGRGAYIWRRMQRSAGGIGEQLGQLKAWLRRPAAPALHLSADKIEQED